MLIKKKTPLLQTLDRVKWAGKLEKEKKRYTGIRVWSTDSPKTAHQPIRLLFDNRCTSAIPFWPTSFIVGVCSREEVRRTATDLQSDRLIDGLIVDGFLPSLVMLHSVLWALILEQCFHDGLEGLLFAFGWCCWWWRCEWRRRRRILGKEGIALLNFEGEKWETRMMGFGGGGGGGGLLAPLPTSAIYVSNLPSGTDENLLADHFGKIGLLKVRNSFFLLFPSPPFHLPLLFLFSNWLGHYLGSNFLRFDLLW